MKYMLIAILAIASLTSCSHHHKRHHEMHNQAEGQTFEELKAWKTKYLATKQEMIKQEQACIDKATDKPGLKKCTEDTYAKWEEMTKDFNKQK